MRTTLSDFLLEIIGAVLPEDDAARVTGLDLDLPIEISLELDATGARPVIAAGPPRWRWTTEFDSRPGRLHVSLTTGGEG